VDVARAVDVADVATAAKRWKWPGRLPPSGERWLRVGGGCGRMVDVADVATRCQAVDVARKTTTVWRAVDTGEWWMLLM